SPALAAEWRRLLSSIVARAGVDAAVMDEHDPTPLDELWRRGRPRMRLHVRLSVGAAHRPPASARGPGADTAALWQPPRLCDRLHRPCRQRVRASRGHVRRDDRVLHRALALRLQRTPVSPAGLSDAGAPDAVRLGPGAARAP